MTAQDRLLTPNEVAQLFRVDPKTVTRWAVAGRLASVLTPGGHRRFRRGDVSALLAESIPPEAAPDAEPDRPPRTGRRITVLCGSTRLGAAFRQANLDLTLEGRIVLTPGVLVAGELFAGHTDEERAAVKQRLDQLHLDKIALADDVLVLNVGGYIGESTAAEIAHARALGRPVAYLEPLRAVAR